MKRINLLAATEKGLFILESDLQRKKWSLQEPRMKGWQVKHVCVDQRSEPLLLASVGSYVYGPCIMLSRDLGESWTQAEQGPRYSEESISTLRAVWCVVPGPVDQPEVFYAGVADAGIFVSRDRAQTWQELIGLSGHATREEWMGGLGGLCCHSIEIDPANPKRLWAAISSVGVFRSEDGGETWQVRNDGLEIVAPAKVHKEIGSCVHRLVLDRRQPLNLYQQNHRGVFRSRDGGDSWQRSENGLPGKFGFPMVMHPHNNRCLYVIPQESDEFRMPHNGQMAVYRSEDGGDNWTACSKGLPGNCYSGVLRSAMTTDRVPGDSGIYFGTSSGAIYYSRNNGDSWEAIPVTLPRISSLSVMEN